MKRAYKKRDTENRKSPLNGNKVTNHHRELKREFVSDVAQTIVVIMEKTLSENIDGGKQ